MQVAVRINKICKSFESGDQITQVLHNINLEIFKQQLTMLVGPSGCGKTTLLSIITGILSPTSGKVFLSGDEQDLFSKNEQEKVLIRRNKIGFIFQQFNLLPSLTAAENACIPLVAAGQDLEKAAKAAALILEKIGMKDHINKHPNQLSGGQQQRVAIARALVHNPEIIVCDEPTASLDQHTGKSVMEILKKISHDKNRSVLVVTHDDRIFSYADRMIQMNDGKITSGG